ncbi:hypothetical protein VPH35_071324 [Triticum aestivum]
MGSSVTSFLFFNLCICTLCWTLDACVQKFHRDLPATTVFVFEESAASATFPGPTIEALQGVPLLVTWENHLPEHHVLPWDPTVPVAIPRHGGVPIVVHLHGGVHPPQSDGSAFAWFTAGFRETGAKWTTPTYVYPNVQSPGVLWYHDHALGLTRANLLAGLLGAYVIHNPAVEWPLGLPCGDEFDRVFVLADRSFYADDSLYMNSTGNNPRIHPQWQPEYFGDAITVNGKAWPFLRVARRRYRFRVINASSARYFNLLLSNGLPFHVVGSDTSYLPRPVTATHVLVSVSESFDVVVDFSDDESSNDRSFSRRTTTRSTPPPPPGHVPGGARPGARRAGRVEELHGQAQRRGQVQPEPAHRRGRGGRAGAREDVEERGKDGAGIRDDGRGQVPDGGHGRGLPVRRHGRARLRLSLSRVRQWRT